MSSQRISCGFYRLAIFLAVTLISPMARAGSSADPLNAFNNMAQETVECAAYFGVLAVAMENSKKPDAAKDWNEMRDKALERAAMVTEQAGLKPETVGARFNIAVQDMIKRIDKNTSNISILMTDYNDLCIEVMTDVKKRGRYWMERGAKDLERQLTPERWPDDPRNQKSDRH